MGNGLTHDIFGRMIYDAPGVEPALLWRALHHGLQRRLRALVHDERGALGILRPVELRALVLGGIVVPVAAAWWLL